MCYESFQGKCERGKLSDDFLFCPSVDQTTEIYFTSFKVIITYSSCSFLILQAIEVNTYGKGKAYSRIEPVTDLVSLQEFRKRFCQLFTNYSHHIIDSWFLTNTKLELQRPRLARSEILFVISDFVKNVTVLQKHDLSEQYFHRVEILLFGAVVSLIRHTEADSSEAGRVPLNSQLNQTSYMISSNYR